MAALGFDRIKHSSSFFLGLIATVLVAAGIVAFPILCIPENLSPKFAIDLSKEDISAAKKTIRRFCFDKKPEEEGSVKHCIYQAELYAEIRHLYHGDAIFFLDGIITSVNGQLTYFNKDMSSRRTYPVSSSWIDAIDEEGIIVYGNRYHQLGIVSLDENLNIISNYVIKTSDALMIDPTITRVGDTYYITETEIRGNVNNKYPNLPCGTYTVGFYRSDDLVNWEHVTDIMTVGRNIEDITMRFDDGRFLMFYEDEELDRAASTICVRSSLDYRGHAWGESIVLLESEVGQDQEPAAVERTDYGYRLFYSSDLEEPGRAYMGGRMYYADFDEDFRLLQRDVPILGDTETGILLNDVLLEEENSWYLINRNLDTSWDMAVDVTAAES